MKRDFVWFLAIVAVVVFGNVNRSGGQQTSEPATDERFCADVNGDGILDLTDGINLIAYLFQGTDTPYCIAQGAPMDGLVTQSQLDAHKELLDSLRRRIEFLEASSVRVVTGSYVGDGTNDRLIETGGQGTLRSLQLSFVDSSGIVGKPELGPLVTDLANSATPYITFDGVDFIVDQRCSSSPTCTLNYNASGWDYYWVAVFAPTVGE